MRKYSVTDEAALAEINLLVINKTLIQVTSKFGHYFVKLTSIFFRVKKGISHEFNSRVAMQTIRM